MEDSPTRSVKPAVIGCGRSVAPNCAIAWSGLNAADEEAMQRYRARRRGFFGIIGELNDEDRTLAGCDTLVQGWKEDPTRLAVCFQWR